jgi:hypothetical protein
MLVAACDCASAAARPGGPVAACCLSLAARWACCGVLPFTCGQACLSGACLPANTTHYVTFAKLFPNRHQTVTFGVALGQ